MSGVLEPGVVRPLKSIARGRCDARTNGYLPSRRASVPVDRYQIILPNDRTEACE